MPRTIIPAMQSRAATRVLAGPILALAISGCSTSPQVSREGLHAGELCTVVGEGPMNCGPADVFLAGQRAKVRVSDFTYDFTLDAGQADVMLVHERMLVDVWSGPYAWDGPYLRVIDTERRTFYRVRFADPVAHGDAERQALRPIDVLPGR